jgi:hypothetical protein
MGNAKMKNLENELEGYLRISEKLFLDSKLKIYRDEGVLSVYVIHLFEKFYKIKLPRLYIMLIVQHNGARLDNSYFDYNDPNYKDGKGSNSIAFEKFENIDCSIDTIKSGEETDWDIKYRFEDGLIPFGDNGGGDLICFDYRKNRDTDNPPIVIWNHDMGLEHRVVFIANSFEEFVDMLHESIKDE